MYSSSFYVPAIACKPPDKSPPVIALVIAAIKPARILKGSFSTSRVGNWLRNGLTTIQFIISMVMISGSFVVHQQMNYFRDKHLGFNQENIITIGYII